MPIGVGYHSGSHFATVQALESVLAPGEVKLTFQGPPNERLDALLDRQVPAATAWGVPLYIAEAFGFRKVLDATFMIGFLVTGADASQGRRGQVPGRAAAGADGDRPASRAATSTTTCGPSRRSTATRWTCGRSAPASASCSCPTPGKSSRRPSSGSRRTSSSPTGRSRAGYDEAALYVLFKNIVGELTVDERDSWLLGCLRAGAVRERRRGADGSRAGTGRRGGRPWPSPGAG